MIDYEHDEPDSLTKIEAAFVIAIYAGSAAMMAWVAWAIWSFFA